MIFTAFFIGEGIRKNVMDYLGMKQLCEYRDKLQKVKLKKYQSESNNKQIFEYCF